MGHDAVILLGDLNYRLDGLPDEAVAELLAANELETLKLHDQLHRHRRAGSVCWGLSEAPLTFGPTYKFAPDSCEYSGGGKGRVPAWTDRILFRGDVSCKAYTAGMDVCGSDHKPVLALLLVHVKTAPHARARQQLLQQLTHEHQDLQQDLLRLASPSAPAASACPLPDPPVTGAAGNPLPPAGGTAEASAAIDLMFQDCMDAPATPAARAACAPPAQHAATAPAPRDARTMASPRLSADDCDRAAHLCDSASAQGSWWDPFEDAVPDAAEEADCGGKVGGEDGGGRGGRQTRGPDLVGPDFSDLDRTGSALLLHVCQLACMHVELLANRYARAGLCVHARTRHSRQVRCAWPEFAYGHTLLPACINMHTCAGVQFPYYQGAVLPPTPQQISIYQSLSAGSAPEEGAGVDRGSLVDA